jgi:hypothetical protein
MRMSQVCTSKVKVTLGGQILTLRFLNGISKLFHMSFLIISWCCMCKMPVCTPKVKVTLGGQMSTLALIQLDSLIICYYFSL